MAETKNYFVTIGFHESFILRLLSHTNATKSDRLVIVVPKPIIGGVAEAIESLRANCSRLHYPEPEVHEIEIKDFAETLSQIVSVINSLGRGIIISNLSAGMRLMDAIILVGLIASRRDFIVYLLDEGGEGREMVIDSSEVSTLIKDYSTEEIKLLMAVEKLGKTTVPELAKLLGKSEKTVMNRISEMKKEKLIALKGKDREVVLTSLGKIVVDVRSGQI